MPQFWLGSVLKEPVWRAARRSAASSELGLYPQGAGSRGPAAAARPCWAPGDVSSGSCGCCPGECCWGMSQPGPGLRERGQFEALGGGTDRQAMGGEVIEQDH